MVRRSQKSDPIELCRILVDCLKGFLSEFGKSNIRERISVLVKANYLLRDLGSSLVPNKDASSARDRILYYLKENTGNMVKGDELMVVSGISEYARRIRELRVEHGWPIISGVTAKDMKKDKEAEVDEDIPDLKPDEYILLSAEQDKDAARRWKIAKALRSDKKLSVRNKIIKYFRKNIDKPVTGEELKYLAGDKSEWARRVRELRTDFGWPIVTKATGRPDLPVGVYVLEEDKQAKLHDRQIKDSVRRAVMMRDQYECQDCNWNRKLWNPDDSRHLEVHHLVMHVKGGSNEEENLITLCNICHDVRHRKEKRD